MSDNTFWLCVLVLCFFSCDGCPGSKLINHYVEPKPCAEQPK